MKKEKNRQAALKFFKSYYIAHRGLFNNTGDAPENTISAFKKAVAAGYGIELDIQLSKDKYVVVSHDNNLKRICGIDKFIKDLSYKEICNFKVLNSLETIPLLIDVLNIINGKAPLIVEIKAEDEHEELYTELCTLASRTLSSYKGHYCIESFSPYVIWWYKKNHPEVIRGQLADNFIDKCHFKSNLKNWILTNMVLNVLTRPDFIAFNFEYRNNKSIQFWKRILDCSLVGWTIKTQKDLDHALKVFDIIIFDSFNPK